MALTEKDKKWLLQLSRATLQGIFDAVEKPCLEEAEIPTAVLETRGAFVTLKNGGQLRGCIGYIEALMPLYKTVMENTLNAALKDPRFPSIQKEEIPNLRIEISAMTPLQEITDAREIKVGEHGLLVEQGFFRGLLLPQVATEYGWKSTEFLQHTCNKAGLPADAWQDKNTEIFVFSAEVFSEE